jgi:metal-responsive CopG/Arc/MetJ family transcriptional regulator
MLQHQIRKLPMTDDLRTTLILPAVLAEAIDDYWHTHRLPSRPETIRELLAKALKVKLPKDE